MPVPPLQPPIADNAPESDILTKYDRQHLVTYMRLLDAEATGAEWRDVARTILHLDPDNDAEQAHHAWQSHLARAHWIRKCGYSDLKHEGPPI